MDRSYADELEPGDDVLVKGWVHEVRDLGGIAFVILRDASGKVQVKLDDSVEDELVERGTALSRESVVAVEGTVEEEERAPTGVEIVPNDIDVLNDAELPTRLDNRTLDLRKEEVKAIFEIRGEVQDALREKFRELDATEINTPKIVATATEGGTDLFPISYFEREAFMNQSPQLFKQMMVGSGLERVFEIGPIFRAEEHNTPRHLNEATSIDFESAFVDDEEAMEFCQDVTVAAYERVHEECQGQLDALGVDLEVPETPFEYLTYDEAIELANSEGIDHTLEWGDDLTTEAEQALGDAIGEHYFVTDWPADAKPFYVMKGDDTARAYDMMHPRMELMSGGQREHRVDRLREEIAAQGLEPEEFEYYLRAFRYGMPPHSGWGLGLERLLVTMLEIENVREVVLFPRDRQRLAP